MSKLLVTIEKIIDIQPIIGADRIMLATVKGWNSIIGKDTFKVGDKCIFIPIDAVIPDKLIEEQKLEYLRGNNRIRTIKLKGTISQGLILPLSILDKYSSSFSINTNEGSDVSKILNITKYEPPVKNLGTKKEYIKDYWAKYLAKEITLRHFVAKSVGIIKTYLKRPKLTNPEFKVYTDINNIKHYPVEFEEGEQVVITEKVHGCLQADTLITLADGTKRTIKEIVDSNKKIKVLGINNKGNLVSSKIIKLFNNGKTHNWKFVKFARKGLNKGNWFGKVVCTENHRFLNPDKNKYIEWKKLKVGDSILVKRTMLDFPYDIKQIMIGKILGDGSLSNNSINFNHKKEHEKYINYTLSSLGNWAGNKQKEQISGFGSTMCRARTLSDIQITNYFKDWYITGHKEFPKSFINIINPIALAFWYMDDGSLMYHKSQNDRAAFAVCGFNEQSVDNLINVFKRFDIIATKYKSGKYWRIRLNSDEADKFFILILPYVPKIMQYKLPKYYRGLDNPKIFKHKAIYKPVLVKEQIIELGNYLKKNLNTTKYDLETETHNYIAQDVVVHNSNGRWGILPIKESFWSKLWSKNTHEFVYGSHNVQKTVLSGNGWYGEDVWGQIAKKYNLKEILPKGYQLFGEVYGPKIQKLTYNRDEIDVVFFDLMIDGKYVDWEVLVDFCFIHQLRLVPILYIGPFSKEILKKETEGLTILGDSKHIREGCVVKPLIEKYSNKCGRKILKSINPEYLLKNEDDNTEFTH